jgi:hypothetical protein
VGALGKHRKKNQSLRRRLGNIRERIVSAGWLKKSHTEEGERSVRDRDEEKIFFF